MKVELLVARSGRAGSADRGAIIDVEKAEGDRMIAAGQARRVRRSEPETAVPRDASEKAAK